CDGGRHRRHQIGRWVRESRGRDHETDSRADGSQWRPVEGFEREMRVNDYLARKIDYSTNKLWKKQAFGEGVSGLPWYSRRHAGDDAGYRQGTERIRRNRFQSPSQPGENQRSYAQARAAARQGTELSDQLDRAQPGHEKDVYHRVTAPRLHSSFFCGSREGGCGDGSATRISRHHFVLRRRSGPGEKRSGRVDGSAGGRADRSFCAVEFRSVRGDSR